MKEAAAYSENGFLRNEYLSHVLILTFIWCTVVAAWDLVMGYAGILNFAQLVFFAGGGYAAGIVLLRSRSGRANAQREFVAQAASVQMKSIAVQTHSA